jgi:hypothetical protein
MTKAQLPQKFPDAHAFLSLRVVCCMHLRLRPNSVPEREKK